LLFENELGLAEAKARNLNESKETPEKFAPKIKK
jgi:hypothetical protein